MPTTRETIGAFEAKTHLSALLDRVANGGEVLITKHGRPVARLCPVAPGIGAPDVAATLAQAREFRARLKQRLDHGELRELIDAGRR